MTAKKKKTVAAKAPKTKTPKAQSRGLLVQMPADLIAELDAYRTDRGLEGEPVARTVAIRSLIRAGLRA